MKKSEYIREQIADLISKHVVEFCLESEKVNADVDQNMAHLAFTVLGMLKTKDIEQYEYVMHLLDEIKEPTSH